jgi:hypothetical protein
MSALLHVARGTAEPPNQEVAEALLSAGQIVARVHRPEQVILRHLRVEGPHEAREPLLADPSVHFFFGQPTFSNAILAASCSASFLALPAAEPSTSPLTTTSTLKTLR